MNFLTVSNQKRGELKAPTSAQNDEQSQDDLEVEEASTSAQNDEQSQGELEASICTQDDEESLGELELEAYTSAQNDEQSQNDQNQPEQLSIDELEAPEIPHASSGPEPVFEFEYSDPGQWPLQITHSQRTFLVEKGPVREPMTIYPTDEQSNNRKFSTSLYSRKMKNGEISDRDWLVYSKSKDVTFCFHCK